MSSSSSEPISKMESPSHASTPASLAWPPASVDLLCPKPMACCTMPAETRWVCLANLPPNFLTRLCTACGGADGAPLSAGLEAAVAASTGAVAGDLAGVLGPSSRCTQLACVDGSAQKYPSIESWCGAVPWPLRPHRPFQRPSEALAAAWATDCTRSSAGCPASAGAAAALEACEAAGAVLPVAGVAAWSRPPRTNCLISWFASLTSRQMSLEASAVRAKPCLIASMAPVVWPAAAPAAPWLPLALEEAAAPPWLGLEVPGP
mmetsp:Transcript_60052/g.178791  ORF Transcript_60052/g.178791 Transcript_60052/m.178791 type:complete len:262 (-) Transcript_60052:47-832(-)